MIADIWQLQQYQVAFDGERNELKVIVALIDKVIGDNEYGIIGFEDGVILMEKGVVSNSEAMTKWLKFRKEII